MHHRRGLLPRGRRRGFLAEALTTWDSCRAFYSYIRAAAEANLPPKQVLLNDPNHTAYDYWDLRLLKAYHFAKDFIREGVPVWWDENDDVSFEVEKRVSRSKAAIQRAEKAESGKDKTPPDGRYYVPVPVTRNGKPLPSFESWTEQQAAKRGKKKP